jgi:hypothetical protein
MVLANREFNHDSENFHESLNIPDELRIKCRERILFTAISNSLQRTELYEDESDAPKSLTTVSGDLQRCLHIITDELEYEYTLIMFNTYQRMASESFAYYKFSIVNQRNNEDRIKTKIMELVEELRENSNDEDAEELFINRLNKKTMMKRINLVKCSHHNFDTYMNLLYQWTDSQSNTPLKSKRKGSDIDDFLNNLFSNEEE